MQQIVVLLVLALVWAAVLIPPHLRHRAGARPADSVVAFQKQLSVLERTGTARQRLQAAPPPRRPLAASGPRVSTRKRRKDVFCGLLAAMSGSLVLGFVPGFGAVHGVHLVLDVLFVAYVVMLVRLRPRSLVAAREGTVRYLPDLRRDAGRAPEPALLLRRSGS